MAASTPPLALYWVFRGREYHVLQAAAAVQRSLAHTRRPSTRVRPQLVRFTLAQTTDSAVTDYAADSYRREHSYFELEYATGSRRRWLGVQAAYLVRYVDDFVAGRSDGWPAEVLHLGLTAAALVFGETVTAVAHSVLPWDAPAEVERRARLEGWDAATAAAMPAPTGRPLTLSAPARVAPPVLHNNAEKGVYGEHRSDAFMRAQGHTKLNDGGLVTPPPPGGSARGNGIDGVWKHSSPPPDYIITEAKYGSSRLGMTKDGRQMDDSWIKGSNRLRKAVGEDIADDVRRAMRRGQVEKRLHHIDVTGQLTESILL